MDLRNRSLAAISGSSHRVPPPLLLIRGRCHSRVPIINFTQIAGAGEKRVRTQSSASVSKVNLVVHVFLPSCGGFFAKHVVAMCDNLVLLSVRHLFANEISTQGILEGFRTFSRQDAT